ncbi:MAG: ABC transporter substrate-binding protein [Phenylobacterium sp.]|uniref:ABC transporter substrate-binding protein n=1 Tax=Phenylobacterium sp. TaxID=1871053 RepID=UPI00391CE31A
MSGAITRRALAAGLTGGLAAAGSARATAPAPRRVVSLNPCLDVILVQVADRPQIAALSHYARDPENSSVGAAGRGLAITYESAEEVVALRPDLVLMARHSSPATRAALQRLGVKAELFGVPESVDASLEQVTRVAAAVGRPQRGAALVARIRAAIAAAAPAPGEARLSAIVYQSSGFASAEGTLMDEMMRRAGLDNAAGRYGLRRTGNIPLEALVADPPDVILAGQPKAGAPTWAERVLTHPALGRLSRKVHAAPFPQRLMFCGGPVLIETAALLAQTRRDALAAGAGRARG